MLEEYLNKYYDKDIVNKIKIGLTKRVTSLRINTLKTNKEEIIDILNKNNIKYEEVTWYKDALIIHSDKEEIVKLNIYEDGLIYLQSLSSMIPPLILNPNNNEQILDMTAAPGSKTSEIASLANNNALITAVERNKKRFERLKYNMDKLGVKKINLMQLDALDIDEYYSFDKILLDAPCSGSGTLSNIEEFDDKLLNVAKIQERLLDKAIKLVKEDGYIVYSTCSILDLENEDIINKILKKYSNIELIKIDKSLFKDIELLPSKMDEIIKVLPTKYYEGFFISILKKNKK